MLFTNIIYNNIYPQEVRPAMLDLFLSKGWYRRRESLFTTNVEFLEVGMHKVWWIRYNLDKLCYTEEAKRIIKKNSRHHIKVGKVAFSEKAKALYHKYRSAIEFTTTEQPEEYLYAGEETIFTSEMMALYDGDRLFGIGVYDKGVESIAGILNFYDPAFKKYSPGKWLMLQKMELARQQGLPYYYTGYVAEGCSKFDYKLFACKDSVEYYSWMYDGWIPFRREMFLKGCFVG